jgi:hypothetical protein
VSLAGLGRLPLASNDIAAVQLEACFGQKFRRCACGTQHSQNSFFSVFHSLWIGNWKTLIIHSDNHSHRYGLTFDLPSRPPVCTFAHASLNLAKSYLDFASLLIRIRIKISWQRQVK